MEINFCKFLSKIGMIDNDTSLTFIKIYNDIYKEDININIFELSFQILLTFLNNITLTQKKYMCHNLPLKYYEIYEKNKKDKLISIIMKNRLKNKINLFKYFSKWKNKSKNKKKEKKEKKKNSIIYKLINERQNIEDNEKTNEKTDDINKKKSIELPMIE